MPFKKTWYKIFVSDEIEILKGGLKMKDLLELRKEIDEIDNQIVALYEKRMVVAEGVAKYKISTGKKVFDKEREEQKLEALTSKASSMFTKHGIRELFEQIMIY